MKVITTLLQQPSSSLRYFSTLSPIPLLMKWWKYQCITNSANRKLQFARLLSTPTTDTTTTPSTSTSTTSDTTEGKEITTIPSHIITSLQQCLVTIQQQQQQQQQQHVLSTFTTTSSTPSTTTPTGTTSTTIAYDQCNNIVELYTALFEFLQQDTEKELFKDSKIQELLQQPVSDLHKYYDYYCYKHCTLYSLLTYYYHYKYLL
jgi:hypothetical protein